MLHVLHEQSPVNNRFTMTLKGAILLSLLMAITAVPYNPHPQQQQQPYPLHHSPLQQQIPQHGFNYKQQLQYQMQQHDKFEYQQHMKQQQQYYQQKYQQQHNGQHEPYQFENKQLEQQQQGQHELQHQQKQQQLLQQQQQSPLQQMSPTSMALMQQHQQQQQQQQQQHSYLGLRPTEMLQTAATLVQEEEPKADALRGQPEYHNNGDETNGSGMKRRPINRKRKRRPYVPPEDSEDEAVNPMTHWRNRNDGNNRHEYMTSTPAGPEPLHEMRHSSQTNVRRRKPPNSRDSMGSSEKEEKRNEYRNSQTEKTMAPSQPTAVSANKNSENLKNILKNNGGLSLSEILQQKNLSLDDLLKGKQNALQALQTTATTPAQKVGHTRYSSKPKLKFTSTERASVENSNEAEVKERPKLSALQKLKLFGASSRPTGSHMGLTDHLTTRKREYPSTSTTTTTTTLAPSTTRIPLYKKILYQRTTLKPSVLLKNSHIEPSAEPTEQPEMSWQPIETSKVIEKNNNNNKEEHEVDDEDDQVIEDQDIEGDGDDEEEEEEGEYDIEAEEMEIMDENVSTTKPDTTTFASESPVIIEKFTTMPITTTPPPSPTTSTTTTTTTTQQPTTIKEQNSSTRRMFITTRGLGRSTLRFANSATQPPSTTSTTTTTTTSTTTVAPYRTTTQQPQTTTTTTSTTTASSSTMNLTPKANLNLNTDDIRERIQETLLKNLIVREDNFRKPSAASTEVENDDDLENFFEETVKPKVTKAFETSTITTRMKQFSSSLVTKPTQSANVIPDFDSVDDRTDLLELIEDRRSGNRLFKVLEQRNMTLEELIEHRKRGSSQLHLATIVQAPSRFYPAKKVLLQDNMDIVTAFENFPHFNLMNLKSVKPDEIKTDSQGSSYFTSIIDIEPTDEVYTKAKVAAGSTPLGDDKVSFLPDRSDKSLSFFPSWKSLALASLASTGQTSNKDSITSEKLTRPFYVPQSKMLLETPSNEDDYDIKENELVLINHEPQDSENMEDMEDEDEGDGIRSHNPIQAAVRVGNANIEMAHDLVDLELSGHGFKRSPVAAGALAGHKYNNFYANMPAGIRSAIVASATIVLTALVTFMVIFAVCRWKQQRQRMTNIIKSYNAMKSKLPTIATTSTTGQAMGTALAVTPSSSASTRQSSLREMSSLMGGSGLSVNATITTTTTGVPNTPSPAASQTTIAVATTALPTSGICGPQRYTAGVCGNKLLQQQQQQQYQQQQQQKLLQQHHHQHHLQRHSSLLSQRLPPTASIGATASHIDNATNLSILSNCNLADLKRSNDLHGSTTSLSFSLIGGHQNTSNISPTCNKKSSNPSLATSAATHSMNTMDANSPEVQEYLFDTLRNSF